MNNQKDINIYIADSRLEDLRDLRHFFMRGVFCADRRRAAGMLKRLYGGGGHLCLHDTHHVVHHVVLYWSAAICDDPVFGKAAAADPVHWYCHLEQPFA